MKWMRRAAHLILAPAFVLTAGCTTVTVTQRTEIPKGARDKHVTVRAYLENGIPRIDRDFHEIELLRHGDRISFLCECDEGLEFTVSEPRLALDLDALDHLVEAQAGETREAKLTSLRAALAQAPDWLARSGAPGGRPVAEADRDPAGFLRSFVAHFMSVVPDEPNAQLLPFWRDPGFRPGEEGIGPFVVGPLDRESIWKFAWTVRVQGEAGSSDEWDPHLMAARDM